MAKDVLMYGTIGEKVDGERFAADLYAASESEKEINIHINSYGGNVQQGLSIFAAIINLQSKGIAINTYVDGFAASIASIIAVAGNKVYINDFARIMIHDAFLPGADTSKLDDKTKEAIAQHNDMITQILSRRGMDTAKITDMMAKETWFRSEVAQSLNFVDEIIPTQIKNRAELIMESNIEIETKIATISNMLGHNPLQIKTKNNLQMENLIAKFGVKTENEIIAKYDGLEKVNKDLANEIDKLKNENKEMKEKIDEQVKNDVTEAVTAACESGKINIDQKEMMIEAGLKDPETVKAMIAAIPDGVGKLSNHIEPPKGEGKETLAKEYEDLAKNNPVALQKLQITSPERFEKMLNAWNEL